jgi:peptide deformylase
VKLNIVQTGDPILRQQARPLDPKEIRSKEIQTLIEQMRETMVAAPGVGLAAPQVGISLQLAVIEDRAEYHKDASPADLALRERRPVPFHVVINPELTITGNDKAEFFEGCLSVEGYSALVSRARTVTVKCLDAFGEPNFIEASGWYARILQHEIDHLRGTLYIDRMKARTFTTLDNWGRFSKGKPIQEIRDLIK